MTYVVNGNWEKALELTIVTTSSPQVFTLPMNSLGFYAATIDWGDNSAVDTITTFNDVDLVHSYASAGTYTLKINGAIGGIQFNNTGGRSLVRAVKYYGATRIDSGFFGCNNLNSFEGNTSHITSFGYAWRSCSSLTSFPLLDVSSGTNFSYTWLGCSSLTTFPLLDVSNGTNFSYTWDGCSSLTTFPLLDVSKGTSFFGTWRSCSSLTSFPLLDVSKGTNFDATWNLCTSLTTFPLLDVSNGTNFAGTWNLCTSLTTFPLLDVSNGTNFAETWRSCSSLTTFPVGMFDNWNASPAASCFSNTWAACSSLTTISVENILVSINASGKSAPSGSETQREITIAYNVATGGLTSNTTDAITALKAKSWVIRINGVIL